MNTRLSPYSQTVFRRKKTRSFSYKIIEYELVNRYWDHLWKKKWSFSTKQLIWEGHPILWPFSEKKKKLQVFLHKKQWIRGGHLIPRQFLEGKKHGVFHIKSLNTSWSVDIEIIYGKKLEFFYETMNLRMSHDIVTIFSKKKKLQVFLQKKQWIWGGHLIPR